MTSTETATQTVDHLIGGEPIASAETYETRDPHDGSLIAQVARGTAQDADRAVAAARKAFAEGPWPRMPAPQRRAILHRLADLVGENAEELALLETRDCGKPITESLHHDMPRVIRNFRFFADYADLTGSDFYPVPNRTQYVLHPPAGVAVAISPWNFPLMLASWKIAPALAFGNTVVHKPPEQAPMTAARLGELALDAGFPEGVLNVVHGFGPDEVGEALTRHAGVDRITFTGESTTGKAIMKAAAENLTPLSFELGGKSANIVFEDADLDEAVPGAIRSVFTNNGEICLAGSRLLVQRSILDEFTERFVAGARALRIGDPKDPDTELGPLVEQQHLEKVASYVELGQEEGGELLCGGGRVDGAHAEGFYFQPTVLGGMTNEMRTSREEIFGPVEVIIPFDTEEDALRMANDSRYGLVGMLWTRDLDRAHRVAGAFKAGTIWVNCFFARDLRMPFGGERLSGIGREGGAYSREFFTDPRAVVIQHRS